MRHGVHIFSVFHRKMPGLNTVSRNNYPPLFMVGIGAETQVGCQVIHAEIGDIADCSKEAKP